MLNHSTPIVLLSRDQLCALLQISDTSRQRLEKTDPTFPPKLQISQRRVAYSRADALDWLQRRRDAATQRRAG